MKRLVSWLFFLALGLTALLLIAPGFIDWSRHKDVLVSELSNRLGQDIRIDGDVSLRLLPNPHLSLEKVEIGSAEKGRYLLSLASLEARMSMDDLLHGQFIIDQIGLQEPVINIAIDDKGSNWRDFWSARAEKNNGASSTADMIVLKQLTVSHAGIVYHNHVTGQEWALPRVNMVLTADSLAGPYQARGDMTYGDAPITFALETKARDADGGLPFMLAVTPIENMPETKISGVFSPLGDQPLTAKIEAHDGKAAALFAPFDDFAAITSQIPAFNTAGDTSFNLTLGDDAVALNAIKISSKSGATIAGDATYHPRKGEMQANVTLTHPGLYWLSYDGSVDILRKQYLAQTVWKIEDAGKLVAGAPPVSVQADGDFSYDGGDNWSLENATISMPDWQGVSLNGQVQRAHGQTGFALAAAQLGIASDVKLNGQLGQSLSADGSATVFGQSLPVTLSGDVAQPDLAVTLTGVNPQDVMAALGVLAKGISVDGGSASFKGKLDLTAANLSRALSGDLALSPQKLKIAGFDPTALQKKLLAMETTPDDLAAQLLAAVSAGEAMFNAKPLSFVLPLSDSAWQMKGLSYDGGHVDFGTTGTESSVSVAATDETQVAYKGKLPLGEKDMPIDRARALIEERHPPAPPPVEPVAVDPQPQATAPADTNTAIGGILDRLDDTPASDDSAVVVKPPQQDEGAPAQDAATQDATTDDMPPQPAPPLQEIEVAPAPALPADTPLAVDIPPPATGPQAAPEPAIPDEIFPVEEDQNAPTP